MNSKLCRIMGWASHWTLSQIEGLGWGPLSVFLTGFQPGREAAGPSAPVLAKKLSCNIAMVLGDPVPSKPQVVILWSWYGRSLLTPASQNERLPKLMAYCWVHTLCCKSCSFEDITSWIILQMYGMGKIYAYSESLRVKLAWRFF